MQQINNLITPLLWTYFGSVAYRFELYCVRKHCFLTCDCVTTEREADSKAPLHSGN